MLEAITIAAVALLLLHLFWPRAGGLAFALDGWGGITDRDPQDDVRPWEKYLTFKGKSGGSAPAPDPQIGAAALKSAQTGQEFLDFTKEAYANSELRQQDIDALAKRVQEQQLGIGDKQMQMSDQQMAAVRQQMGIAEQQAGWATEDRNRYKNVFQPVEDQFIAEATGYGTPEREAQMAAEARADVQSNAQAQRQISQRNMMAMGVNPNSGRFAGQDRATELSTALASAGAQNGARTQVRDKALALKADVANMGRGLPAQSAQATSLGLGAIQGGVGSIGAASGTLGAAGGTGTTALNGMLAANQANNQAVGMVGAGYSGAMQGLGQQGNLLNTQFQGQLQKYAADQQASGSMFGGIGSLVGTGIGAYAALSSKEFKENKRPVDGALEALREAPAEAWDYKEGIADEGAHVGPYAEDFQKATGLGDGKKILHQDAIGITMAAVQELDKNVQKLAARIDGKPKRLASRVNKADRARQAA